LSAATLTDALMFRQFLDFMDANRALASSLMFEFTQEAYRSFGPIEHESLAALSERGFRFSMDHVADLHMEPNELADRSFRFLKVPAKLLLNKVTATHSDIDPEDLADLLARSGIDLIAERIETETTVVDLLDYDVRFGQGFLFSPPRPVRAEALHGTAAEPIKPGVGETPGALLAAS
jgi:cyclic-di-GMP phosphodiesterase, flagellum assembly factor TipF